MAADELGGRMHHDVRTPIDWAAAVRAREGVVDDQRNIVLVGNARYRFDIEHVDLRIAEGFGKDAFRLRRDRAPDGLQVADVDEDRIDPDFSEGDVELVDGAAVQGGRSDEFVAGIHQGKKRDVLRCLP
jgi:hypothetical protein